MPKREEHLSKIHALRELILFIVWIVGILVALTVGSGMISGTLTVGLIPAAMTISAGWTVIALTIIAALLAIIERLAR